MGFLSLGLGRLNARKTDLQGFERHRGALLRNSVNQGFQGVLGRSDADAPALSIAWNSGFILRAKP